MADVLVPQVEPLEEIWLGLKPTEAALLLRLIAAHLSHGGEPFPYMSRESVMGLAMFLHDVSPEKLRTPLPAEDADLQAA